VFSFVPQDNMLFLGSVKENITFNKEYSFEEIKRVLDLAKIDFVDSENSLDLSIGENGLNLSIGQGQRIAIARALLTGAPVLLLDEATSALDEDTERQVLSNLSQLKDITLIIISHKKSAFSICNRKIRLKDRSICEE
jgi:ATP-binding cassette subfamily B protein